MVEEIERDPTIPTKRVYNNVIQQANDARNVPQFHSVQSKLARKRASLMPPIPQTIKGVDIQGE